MRNITPDRAFPVVITVAVVSGLLLFGYLGVSMLIGPKTQLTTTELVGDTTKEDASVAAASNQQAVIVMEPQTAFSQIQRDEITAKFVAPFIDYSQVTPPEVATIHITMPTKKADTWEVFVVFKDGTYTNFFYGNSKDSAQSWWIPTCEGNCKLSEQFSLRYPEIAAKISPN